MGGGVRGGREGTHPAGLYADVSLTAVAYTCI